MKKLFATVLTLLLLTANVYGVDDAPCIYSAVQEGDTVTVRLNAPENGFLLAGVYDARTGRMHDVRLTSVAAAQKPQSAVVRWNRAISDAESVRAFFLKAGTLAPFCEAMPTIIPVGELNFVLNANTMKFHYDCCPSARTISARNRRDYHGTRDSVISMGYEPCNNCRP